MGGIISCHFCLFVVLGYPSFLSLFCSCSFWDVLRMHHLVLLTFPASACFHPRQKKILRPNQELRKYEISSTWLQSMFLFHVTMCDTVTSLILSLSIRLIAQLPHPILLHSSNQAQFVKPGSNQTAPIKSNLSTLDQTKVSNQVQLVKAKAEFSNQVQFVRASTGIAGCKSVEAFHT